MTRSRSSAKPGSGEPAPCQPFSPSANEAAVLVGTGAMRATASPFRSRMKVSRRYRILPRTSPSFRAKSVAAIRSSIIPYSTDAGRMRNDPASGYRVAGADYPGGSPLPFEGSRSFSAWNLTLAWPTKPTASPRRTPPEGRQARAAFDASPVTPPTSRFKTRPHGATRRVAPRSLILGDEQVLPQRLELAIVLRRHGNQEAARGLASSGVPSAT